MPPPFTTTMILLFILFYINATGMALPRPAVPPPPSPSLASASSSSSIPLPVPLNLPLEMKVLNDLFPPMPPHCSKAVVTPSHPSSLSGSNIKNLRNRLNIGVGQTVCFKTDETSNPATNSTTQLHTLTLSRLEQYHSITQRYRFAIPEVETKCICECSAKTAVCQAEEYSYGRCSSSSPPNTACHRTFFSDQPATGCPSGSGGEPRLCCELKFRPYENRTYTALRLEVPTTFAVLRYSAFSWEDGRWKEEDKRTIRIYLDGSTQNQFLDSQKNLELSINSMGKSSNQLSAGMYFVENLGHGSYGELIQQPLNEVTDHNFERLGWFRQDSNGQFFVNSGYIMMDKIHRAKAENCMEQKFQSILDANFYINKYSNESTKFQIAESLNRTFRWIKSARVVDSEERHAIVTENEGTNLEITLTSNVIEKLAFVHNASQIQDFTATIIVDRFSNSVLNITVFNATGILNGYIKNIIDYKSEHIDSFTLYVPESSPVTRQLYARIKPYPSNTVQMVCLRPDDSPKSSSEVCRPVESIQDDLAKNEIDNRWTDQTGKCPECNHISMDGLMKYLNPMSWTSGISSVSDFFMLLTDILVYFSLSVFIYVIFTRCLYPLMKCCICPTMPCMPCYSNGKK